MGMRGLVGWAVVMPVLVGAGLGPWLDARRVIGGCILPMPVGLALGCFNAWRRGYRDRREIRDPAGIDYD